MRKKIRLRCLKHLQRKQLQSTSLIKKSSLSTKSSRIFIPSTLKSKNKGFEVDEKGLLRIIAGFDDSLKY